MKSVVTRDIMKGFKKFSSCVEFPSRPYFQRFEGDKMAPTVAGIKTCQTTRNALKALEEAGKSPKFRDLRKEPPDAEELGRWLAAFGDRLVNRSSTTWRGLSDAERKLPAAELLAAHPTLIKRPVIEIGRPVHAGLDRRSQVGLDLIVSIL